MKNLLFVFVFVLSISAAADTAFAQQCDKSRLTPIKCGYYEEGYQDGAIDGRNNSSNDHRRYRSKFENQYESFYQNGYDEGYASVKPFARWTDSQKNTYDQAYDDGKRDRSRNISRLPARYQGQYDSNNEVYYQVGYFDGYDNRQKQYDKPIVIGSGSNPGTTFPQANPRGRGRGSATGFGEWKGSVDNRVNLVIKGDEIKALSVAGPFNTSTQNLEGILPRRNSTLTVLKTDGRGTVTVIQQPSRNNDFTGIVQISDPNRGRDNYGVQFRWVSANTIEPYSSGKVTWRGRVDGTVAVRVNGDFVESVDETQNGLSQVTFQTQGYLAARPGSVRVSKRNGRGQVYVAEQPSEQNDYTAIIKIFDPERSDDMYEIEITW